MGDKSGTNKFISTYGKPFEAAFSTRRNCNNHSLKKIESNTNHVIKQIVLVYYPCEQKHLASIFAGSVLDALKILEVLREFSYYTNFC